MKHGISASFSKSPFHGFNIPIKNIISTLVTEEINYTFAGDSAGV